ncbi:MAG: Nif11 family protein [Phormidesmis sp. CAN_BIN36]|nr:Nif11 family protein [Phormidesmis sp. CAN_BIN36]
MSKQVEQFHHLVLQNQLLKQQLKATADRPAFVSLAVELGKEQGYSFTSQEVEVYVDRHMFILMSQFS